MAVVATACSGKIKTAAANSYEVEVCARPAELPLAKQLGIDHWWLRTPDFELGMGPKGGGVPGDVGNRVPKTLKTTLNDHHGRGDLAGSTCVPAGDMNQRWRHELRDCLLEAVQEGKDTGLWIPPINDCHDVVRDILDRCADPSYMNTERLPMGLEVNDGGTR